MKNTNEAKGNYDSAYKALFSNPAIFCQLVKGFVEEDFVRELKPKDFKGIENRSFISQEFLKREADLIYHVELMERDIYFYILMEFQSTPDKRIPVRLFCYLLLFYEQLIKHSQSGKLPAIFPMVVYNGLKPWKVPLNIRDSIEGGIIPENYLLKGEYYLLDESRVAEEKLKKLHNLAAAVIYYEKHRRSDDLKQTMSRMMDLLAAEDFNDVRQVLIWAGLITSGMVNEKEISKLRTLQEGRKYMEGMTSQWEINIRNKALQEGIRQGEKGLEKARAEGREEGREEVREEGLQKLYSIVRSMKLKGFENSLISELTGLSEEEISKID